MHLDGQSPLAYSVSDGIMTALVSAIIIVHLVVFMVLLRDRRDLIHTIFFGLIVLYFPVAGPVGYVLWRGRDPQKRGIGRRGRHRTSAASA